MGKNKRATLKIIDREFLALRVDMDEHTSYPKTKVHLTTETIHGKRITDPYRWLENGERSMVKQWVDEQNAHTNRLLGKHVNRAAIKKDLLKYVEIDSISVTVPKGEWRFWRERKAQQNQPVLYAQRGRQRPRVLLDPNRLNRKGTTTIDYWYASPKGTYLVYGLSEDGTELATLSVMRTATGKKMTDSIPNARYSEVAWLPDETGFFYTRYPTPGTVPKGDEMYHERLFFHALGSDSSSDPLVFGEGLPKEDMLSVEISDDGRFLAIKDEKGWSENDVYLYDIHKKKIVPVVTGMSTKFFPRFHRGILYLRTNLGAPRYRVLAADVEYLPKRLSEWKVVVPEESDILDDITFVSDHRILSYIHNVTSQLIVTDIHGRKRRKVTLPTLGTVTGIGSENDRPSPGDK